jgi:hypothetical protein
MSIKRFFNVGGITNITRYVGLMFGSYPYVASSNNLIVGSNSSPYIVGMTFDTAYGIGTKYADPTSIGASTYDIQFNNSRTTVAAANVLNTHVFPFSNSGFGTKYSDPATAIPGGTSYGASFSTSDNAILIATSSTPYINAYAFSSGFGTKYSNPATLPSGTSGSSAKLTDSYAFIGTNATPYVAAYPFSSSTGFGTKYSDPATVGTYDGYNIDYNANNGVFVYGSIGYTYAYPFSAGFGTKYSQPATSPGSGYSVKFNRSGTAIAVANNVSSPYIYTYPWSSGWGTKHSDPASPLSGGLLPYRNGLAFGYTENVLGVLNNGLPYVQVYLFSAATGLGLKYVNSTVTFASGASNGIAFN